MPEEVVAVSSYWFKPEDRLLLDTNVWFSIYGVNMPKQNDRKMTVYSEAFKKMIDAGCRIYIDVLIASEFINRYSRVKWELWKSEDLTANTQTSFKKFRNSNYFLPIAKEIADLMKKVLGHCKRIESGFEVLEINTLIDKYGQSGFDFNDQIIVEICKRKGLKLVTDDRDFKSGEILVLTDNQKLLH